MDALTLPGKTCDPLDFESIRVTVDTARCLEDSLAGILELPGRRITFIGLEDDARSLLLGIVRFANGSEVFFSLPEELALVGRTLFDPREGIQELADTGAPILDEEWLARRDRELRIRSRRGLDAIEMEVAPAHGVDVILSYALARFGQADIVRDAWFDRNGGIHPGLRLDLSCLGDDRRPGIGETVWIDWNRFVLFSRRRRTPGIRVARQPQ